VRSAAAAPYFAITAPGLEPLTAAELGALGIAVRDVEPGGVHFDGARDAILRANLHARTASRIVVRLGEFEARHFAELERQARRQPWERFLARERAVRLRVSCRKSKLYHSDAVAQRVAEAIEHATGARSATLHGAEEDIDLAGGQLILVRLFHDRCTISIDASGELLHRRGYRLATAKAPMRETLAAAMLLAAEWRTDAPLLDPMCGSGTIAIEGAMLARRIAPGARRAFAFEQWPEFERAEWDRARDAARAQELPHAPGVIQASDRDAGAIEAAQANAQRAGVGADIELSRRALSAIAPPATRGWIVTNPPYGLRVGERRALRDLYAQLGNVARRACPGWTLTLLSAHAELERQTAIPLAAVARTRNGGVPVRIVRGEIPSRDDARG
jgi:putative N6-adenine-specific DNA methylase